MPDSPDYSWLAPICLNAAHVHPSHWPNLALLPSPYLASGQSCAKPVQLLQYGQLLSLGASPTPSLIVDLVIFQAPARHPARHNVQWCHWYICLVVSHLSYPCNVQGYIYPGRIHGSCWAGLPLSSRAERGATPLTFLHAFTGPAPYFPACHPFGPEGVMRSIIGNRS